MRALKIYYAILLPALVGGVLWNPWVGYLIVLPLWMIGCYALYWWFSRGLPETEPPPRPSREEVRVALRAESRSVGALVFWVFALLSGALTLLAGFLWASTGEITMVGAALFFGFCTGIFVWRLTHFRKGSASQAPQH